MIILLILIQYSVGIYFVTGKFGFISLMKPTGPKLRLSFYCSAIKYSQRFNNLVLNFALTLMHAVVPSTRTSAKGACISRWGI